MQAHFARRAPFLVLDPLTRRGKEERRSVMLPTSGFRRWDMAVVGTCVRWPRDDSEIAESSGSALGSGLGVAVEEEPPWGLGALLVFRGYGSETRGTDGGYQTEKSSVGTR
jgi:hypothetical protein